MLERRLGNNLKRLESAAICQITGLEIHGFWKGWSMSDKMMVIPLRVPRQTGIDWKVEAVKQGISVQRWILDRLQDTPKTPQKPPKVASAVVPDTKTPTQITTPTTPSKVPLIEEVEFGWCSKCSERFPVD